MGNYITAHDGTNIFVEDVGTGDAVVFLHGWPANNNMFEYQKNALLEAGYRYVGIDYRGYGKSDAPATGYDYATMASDVHMVVNGLGVKDFTLVGFSMGGAIAIRYAVDFPDDGLKKLVLSGAAAPVFTQRPDYPYGMTQAEVDALIEDTLNDRPKMLEGFGEIFFEKEHSKPMQNWFHHLSLVASSHGTIASAKALRDEDLREDLPKVNVETLIIHGVHDKICPFEFALEMEKGIPNSRIERFEESGHGTVLDEMDKFNKTLLGFI
ncbi:alpha/beta hydrolase [Exiguobacterium sp. SL-10]|jgi:pimeloyl-ACP methyl ester carboxylesterase|uniref:alpha/beta fold hydrolase n=1 Tax=unclassified Exiguobacterium TaxID=2644629 RepID=UPI00103F5BAE|nr:MULTISPECIES: alpha/beta hydrolase [unclassified Exiguobacterium]TCI22446.1 alpha/beta hydrolase [Exiguobacterium sp. SL-9]TCI30238.1 alpha/beta hydrolase [Exiguobacterium sp. SL-10]